MARGLRYEIFIKEDMADKNELLTLRADKWLWATRFFKTRSQASKACEGGKVKRDGDSIKPSTVLKPGDILTIPAHEANYQKRVKVLQIIEKRVSAAIAREAYEDHTDETLRSEAREAARVERIMRQEGDQGRLTKKRRRDWEKMTGGFFQ